MLFCSLNIVLSAIGAIPRCEREEREKKKQDRHKCVDMAGESGLFVLPSHLKHRHEVPGNFMRIILFNDVDTFLSPTHSIVFVTLILDYPSPKSIANKDFFDLKLIIRLLERLSTTQMRSNKYNTRHGQCSVSEKKHQLGAHCSNHVTVTFACNNNVSRYIVLCAPTLSAANNRLLDQAMGIVCPVILPW